MSEPAGGSVCEVLGEHLTAIPVVNEALEVIGYYCGACGAVAGPDRVFPPPDLPAAVVRPLCRVCGARMAAGYLVPLPDGDRPPALPLAYACSPRCVAALLAPHGCPDGAVRVIGEAVEAWRRWLADPRRYDQWPSLPAEGNGDEA